jgi:hypothetical protein
VPLSPENPLVGPLGVRCLPHPRHPPSIFPSTRSPSLSHQLAEQTNTNTNTNTFDSDTLSPCLHSCWARHPSIHRPVASVALQTEVAGQSPTSSPLTSSPVAFPCFSIVLISLHTKTAATAPTALPHPIPHLYPCGTWHTFPTAAMVLRQCTVCGRRFTKTEHFKRHERSRMSRYALNPRLQANAGSPP